jgi:tRNA pseudouridine55 synthase
MYFIEFGAAEHYNDNAMENGILLLDKDAGMTSRDVDNAIQEKFGTKKAGHLGTLDPFATGLLIVAINKGTKYLPFLDDEKKSYLARLELGVATDTGDPAGKALESKEVPPLTDEFITATLASFVGRSLQTPPMYSAIKEGGEPLYEKARQGKNAERKPRNVEIYDIHLIRHENNVIDFTATVSRGTYIRVLGEDIAKKLSTVGHLSSLRRLSIGPFLLDKAKKLADLGVGDLLDPTVMVTTMKHVEIDEAQALDVKNGKPLTFPEAFGELILVALHGEGLAVYRQIQGGFYRPERGLF